MASKEGAAFGESFWQVLLLVQFVHASLHENTA